MLSIKTETGSTYHVAPERKTWVQIVRGAARGPDPLRTRTGTFLRWSGATVGQRMVFIGEGLEIGTRFISTSLVVSVTVVEDDDPKTI